MRLRIVRFFQFLKLTGKTTFFKLNFFSNYNVIIIPGSKPKPNKGKLVKSKKLDYRNIMWPRDALYISYKDDKFEYITDLEAQDEPTYYCDCCDPARQKKRAHSDGKFFSK